MKPKRTQSVMYPTYASYRELAGRAEPFELREMVRFYGERHRECSDPNVKECYADALRACEDETLSRQYEEQHPQPDPDDPFFETEVDDYQPSDMIDFGC